jgi:hypothetical protein
VGETTGYIQQQDLQMSQLEALLEAELRALRMRNLAKQQLETAARFDLKGLVQRLSAVEQKNPTAGQVHKTLGQDGGAADFDKIPRFQE